MPPVLRHIIALLVATAVVFGPVAGAGAYDGRVGDEPATDDDSTSIHDRLGIRTGLLFQGLAGAEDTGVFSYLDFAARSKSGEYYVDIRAPAAAVILDGALLAWRVVVMDNYRAEPILEMLNPTEPSHWELAHARLGYRFRLVPPGDYEIWQRPWEAAVGAFGTADLVFFDAHRNITRDHARPQGYNDPLVIGAGGFFALGRTHEQVQYDVALGVGRAVAGSENNPDRDITIVTTDADIQFTAGFERVAFYIRPRLTGYITQMDPAFYVTGGLTGGVNVGF